jgi:hypothetical protein
VPTLSDMTKTSARRSKSAKQQVQWWRILRIRGAGTVYLGEVEASDEAEALSKAIQHLQIEPAHRNRLIARPSEF